MTQNLNSENEKEEKLEFLKREEIRTMAKDIAELRELEAQKERERIAVLKTEEKIIPVSPEKPEGPAKGGRVEGGLESSAEATEGKKEEMPVGLMPKLSKKSSSFQKIFIRAGLILILFLIASFFYWFFVIKNKTPSEEIITPPQGEITPEEKIALLPSLISVKENKTFEVSNAEEIPAILSYLMESELTEGTLTQISIKNLKENRLVSLRDLALAWQIEIPEEIYPKLEENFTLAVYSQKEGKRIVFIGKVKEKEGLLQILKDWESQIEKNGLFLSREKIKTSAAKFKTAFHNQVGFRFLTVSSTDLGICYAWFDDYIVFAASFESMKKVIDEVKAKELESQIGQLFIIGFKGKTLTPQLEEIFRKYRPGGVLLLSKNIESAEQLKKLTQDLKALSLKETGLPLLIAVDQEGGAISRINFTQEKTPQSEIENSDQAYQIGLSRGNELRELGVNLNLAPVLDITSEDDFLFERSFQKSLGETGELAKSLIEGQKTAGILTAIKHFPGYSGITLHPEGVLAEVETTPEIAQFKTALESNPELVMTANVIYKNLDPTLPFTFSPKAIQFLKNNLGSEIPIISDDLAQDYLLERFSLKDIIIKPVQAGIDLLIFSGWEINVEEGLNTFFEAFKNGEISQIKLKAAVSRIIKLKENLAI